MREGKRARDILIALLLAGVTACGCSLPPTAANGDTGEAATAAQIEAGPYDRIELPLNDVPAPSPDAVFHPAFEDPERGAFVQVLRVLTDPRQIPLDRWLSYQPAGGEPITHPHADVLYQRLSEEGYQALPVYVQVQAPEEASVRDPFSMQDAADEDSFAAWPRLEVADPSAGTHLPCAPLDYTAGRDSVQTSSSGRAFDPRSFTPPLPWYDPQSQNLAAGETRAGWLLCLAPVVDMDEIQLTWRFTPAESEIEQRITVWESMERMAAGAWHLIPHATVLAWNEDNAVDEASAGEGMPPPPGVLPTPTSVIPQDGSSPLYEGPVWVSVGIGMAHERPETVILPANTLQADVLSAPAPGDCAGVGVWHRYEAPYRVICQPNNRARFGRFFLQFSFPGMEALQEDWDRMVLADRISLELFTQDNLDGLFSSFEGVEIQYEATWIRADLPDDLSTVWVRMAPEDQGGRAAVWQVDLYNAAAGSTSTEKICEEVDCLDVNALSMDPADQEDLRMQMPIPVLGMGEYAHGVTMLDAWTTSQVVLVNDNTQGQDFFPVQRTDPWLFIDIATVTDRADDIYMLYPDGAGGYLLQPLENS